MNYRKQAHTKLHHVEVHPMDDGTHMVEAHLIHKPPVKKGEHLVPPNHDYPNKVHRMTADDHEEATEHVGAILEAHQHEKVRRANSAGGNEDATENTRQPGNNGQDEWDEAHANYED